ncbi:MAG: hypothetical protein GY869_05680 [Planctomycetes bacterium]|nr:hypothetical protein [Planctomycetota bacterium]
MHLFDSLLAQATTDTEKIDAIYQRINGLPDYIFYDIYWLAPIIAAVIGVFLFLRQKKIARNQVNIAQMIQELLDK